jgi:hypothetical protein
MPGLFWGCTKIERPFEDGLLQPEEGGLVSFDGVGRRGIGDEGADSDDLARVYRFDLARDSEMISPPFAI